MTENTLSAHPLSAPGILAVALAFALTALVAYDFVLTQPEAEQLVRWAQVPISTLTQ